MHNNIRRLLPIAVCALAISLAVMNLPTTAASEPASAPAKPAATGDLDRASALFDKGKYAKAKEILDGFLAAPPAGVQQQELRKAQLLLDRVKGVLLDQYQAVEAARQRAKADESKRAQEMDARQAQEKRMRADADRLFQQGQYEEAGRLYNQIASNRAADFFNLAMNYYDEGLYDNARKVFERLSKFIEDQRHANPQFKSGLGVEREQRIAEYLEKIPDAKDNLVEAALLARAAPATPPPGPTEAQRAALKAYDEALRAFDNGRFDEARRQFEQILNSGVSLGKEKDEQLRAKLSQIALRQKDIETRRAAALAEMKSGEELLSKNDWRGAGEFLNKAIMDKELLTESQRAQLVALLTKAADERKKAESLASSQGMQAQAEAEAVKRQEDYLDFVKKQQQILDQQERATAEMYVDLAKVDFETNLNYDAALKNIQEALNHQPDNAEALKMRAEILALQGKSLDITVYYDRLKSQEKAVIDEVLTQINLAVQRGRTDMAAKDYPNAIDQFSRALDSLDYLAPVSDIRMAQSQVKGLLKQAQDAQAEAELQQKRAREFEALQEREQALREEAERGERRKLALFAEANAEFAKGKYESAIKLAEQVIAVDPENGAAHDLIDDARQALQRKTWDSIIETDAKAVQDERVRMRMKAIFPGALFMYPAKELWEEIKARPRVELPSGQATKTPKELDVEARLDEPIPAVSLPQGTSLPEAIEILKNLLPKTVNFILDPDQAVSADLQAMTLPNSLDLHEVTLRTLLQMMLRPRFNFVISHGNIFISTYAGARREEAQDENLSLRQYDISDLMVVIETTGGASGGTTGGGGGGGTGGGGGGTSTGGSAGGQAGVMDVLQLLYIFTGAQNNWDSPPMSAQQLGGQGGGGGGGGGGGRGGGGGLGGAGGAAGGGGGLGALLGAVVQPNREGAGRLMYLRGVWLMVNHVDRIHKKIEEILEVLRAQTHMQVQIEATFMTFSDLFVKDIGIQWQNLPALTTGHQSFLGMQVAPAAGIISYNNGEVANGVFQLSVSFLNSSQTKMLINAAEQSTNVIATSSPHMTVVNTVSTTISLNTIYQYIENYVAQGNFVIPVIGNYGSTNSLSVQPWITADRRYVWMVVNPSIVTAIPTPTTAIIPIAATTTVLNGTTITGSSVTVPITTLETQTNSVTATVKCPDRGTVVIGGFTRVNETRAEQGVPVLSHIPVIKRLFLSTTVNKSREHDIFLVTPTILLEKEYEP